VSSFPPGLFPHIANPRGLQIIGTLSPVGGITEKVGVSELQALSQTPHRMLMRLERPITQNVVHSHPLANQLASNEDRPVALERFPLRTHQ
jgi:hypothetical protein